MHVSRLYLPKHFPVYSGDIEFCASPFFLSQNTTFMPLWMLTGTEWSQVFQNAFTLSDKGDPWRCSILPITLVPLLIWSSSSTYPEMGLLTQMVVEGLKYRGCHHTSWTPYDVCETGNPHSMTTALEAQKVFKGLNQETMWWHKEQKRDTLPVGPLLEDKLFPPLSSLTHK